ncbi:hypothetical protein Pelo_676 [Pelomyxa schiedti]|nr:hypothetical protein Pelo_676 [Pelomyxa schiedti]
MDGSGAPESKRPRHNNTTTTIKPTPDAKGDEHTEAAPTRDEHIEPQQQLGTRFPPPHQPREQRPIDEILVVPNVFLHLQFLSLCMCAHARCGVNSPLARNCSLVPALGFAASSLVVRLLWSWVRSALRCYNVAVLSTETTKSREERAIEERFSGCTAMVAFGVSPFTLGVDCHKLRRWVPSFMGSRVQCSNQYNELVCSKESHLITTEIRRFKQLPWPKQEIHSVPERDHSTTLAFSAKWWIYRDEEDNLVIVKWEGEHRPLPCVRLPAKQKGGGEWLSVWITQSSDDDEAIFKEVISSSSSGGGEGEYEEAVRDVKLVVVNLEELVSSKRALASATCNLVGKQSGYVAKALCLVNESGQRVLVVLHQTFRGSVIYQYNHQGAEEGGGGSFSVVETNSVQQLFSLSQLNPRMYCVWCGSSTKTAAPHYEIWDCNMTNGPLRVVVPQPTEDWSGLCAHSGLLIGILNSRLVVNTTIPTSAQGQCVALATASFSRRCGAASWARLLTPPLVSLICSRHVLPASPAARVAIHFGRVTASDDDDDDGSNITAVVGVSHTRGVTCRVVAAPSDGWRLLGWCAGASAAAVYERRQLAQVRDAATGRVRHEVRHRGAIYSVQAGDAVHVNGRWLVSDVGNGWTGERELVVWRLEGLEVDVGMKLCFSEPRTGMGMGPAVQCRWVKLMTDVVPGGGGTAHENEVAALVYSYNSGERALVVADLEKSWNACTTPTCFGPLVAVVVRSWPVPELQPYNYPSQAVPIPERDDYLVPLTLKDQLTVSLFSVKYGRVVSEIPCAFHFNNSALFDIGNGLFGVHTTKNKQSVFDGNGDTSVPVNTITTLGDVYPSSLFGGGGVMCLFNDNYTATLVDPETSSILFSVSVVGGFHVRSQRFFPAGSQSVPGHYLSRSRPPDLH